MNDDFRLPGERQFCAMADIVPLFLVHTLQDGSFDARLSIGFPSLPFPEFSDRRFRLVPPSHALFALDFTLLWAGGV